MVTLSNKPLSILILIIFLFIFPPIIASSIENIDNRGASVQTSTFDYTLPDTAHDETTYQHTFNSSKSELFYSDNQSDPSFELQQNQDLINLRQAVQETRELYNDRIRFTSNSDGTTTAEFYIKPVFYLDEYGAQQFIDTTIATTRPDGGAESGVVDPRDSYKYENLKNNLKLYFKNAYTPGLNNNIIRFEDQNHQYPITWQPAKISISSGNILQTFEEADGLERNFLYCQGAVKENKIVFEDIYPGIDDSYIVKPNELKHDFILKKYNDGLFGPEYTSSSLEAESDVEPKTLNLYGILTLPQSLYPRVNGKIQVDAFETNTSIDLCLKDSDSIIYRIQEPLAFEQSNPMARISCRYEVIPLGPEWTRIDTGASTKTWMKTLLVLKTDLNWLTSPDRRYPVVIDPSVSKPDWDKGEEGYDTYLVKGNETEPEWTDYNYGESKVLKVTLAGPSLYSHQHFYHRSILKFPGLRTLSENTQVTEAKLILQCTTPGTMSITVFQLYDDWLEGTGTEAEPGDDGATWNSSGYNLWSGGNYDGHVTTHATVSVEAPYYYEWNIKDIVENWISDPIANPNNGFLLTGTDNEDVIKVFHSSEVSNINVRPKVTIKYNTPPIPTGLEEITIYETQPTPQPKIINRTDIFWDPDVDELASSTDEIEFELWNGEFEEYGRLKWVSSGIFNSKKNFSVELKLDDRLYITPFTKNETYGTDIIKLRIRDLSSSWTYLDLVVNVIATNDVPVIRRIGGTPDFNREIFYATEDELSILPIEIYDPDNPDFYQKANPKDGDAGDLDFDWERDKTHRFVISEVGNITFNPDNSLVGTFYMNLTVYDTEWYKKGKRILKRQLSNASTMITFMIENSNDRPDKPRILEPKPNSGFSTEDTITFRGICTDDDLLVPESNELLTFKWILGDNTPLGQGRQIKTKLTKGTHLITLRVEDRVGEFSEVNTTIIVRNKATIDELNCSHLFTDEDEDVLCFYYEITDDGVETFRAERGTFSTKYSIFNIDTTTLTSKRFQQSLLVNLTITENITYILESQNHKYEFAVYLVKPNHKEEVINLDGIPYLG
ncbi:DNRLRE domain-containing protein, partial [[Eubacterium] cellulosolvens]